MPSLATVATVGLLMIVAFALGQRQQRIDTGTPPYKSPCLLSWDENDSDSTFCIMTREAAQRERTQASFDRRP